MHAKFYIRSFTNSWDIRGTLKIVGVTWQGHAPFWGKIITGICLDCPYEYAYQNFTFVALPVPEILGGTLKILGVMWQGHAPFSEKMIKGICLDCPCEYAYQVLRS